MIRAPNSIERCLAENGNFCVLPNCACQNLAKNRFRSILFYKDMPCVPQPSSNVLHEMGESFLFFRKHSENTTMFPTKHKTSHYDGFNLEFFESFLQPDKGAAHIDADTSTLFARDVMINMTQAIKITFVFQI